MKRKTEAEVVEHLKAGVTGGCIVCGSPHLGTATDYHGETRCWCERWLRADLDAWMAKNKRAR
jgi:hypothetical protein